MATSFLPDTTSEPVEIPEPIFEEQDLTLIPETPMPLEALEGHPDENEHFLETQPEATETSAPTPVAPDTQPSTQPTPKPIPQIRNDLAVQIEKIMEENLGDVFSALTPVQKQQFKIKGEETANKIRHIIQTTTAKLGKIIQIIFDWLKILPGINHFFLEQEAKIKAEKIIALSNYNKNLE